MTVGAGDGPLLRLARVNKWFGEEHVLRDVDLSLDRGEVLAIIGPSGSGKSTLCRTINGLEPVQSGEIVIDGRPLPASGREVARTRSEIGMVFQGFNLFAAYTALENVTLAPIRVHGERPERAEQRGRELLERVGLADEAGKLPGQLSGGQQQRVAIARALAMEPKLILFDEPTSALDPEMTAEVLAVMTDLAREGRTMVVVTHVMGFARRAADRVVFMADGRILESAAPATFFERPGTDRARAFLAGLTV